MEQQSKQQASYLGPFLAMVFLFFIVGFLTTANTQFQGPLKETFLAEVGGLKNTFATLITFSWFLAYPLSGGVGSRWINRYGYKGTLIRGLVVMIVGLGLFFLSSWFTVRFPEAAWRAGESVVPYGFLIFLIGSFVVGASATILQVVINPYLTACYVRGTQPIQRLAIGGSANSVGTTLAPYFVTGVVFGGLSMSEIRIDQLMLPFFSLMVVIMLVVFLLMRFSLPDVQGTKAEAGEKLERSVWSFRHLALGVVAIFFYVGVEVCIGGNINLYAMEMGMASPALLATLYWGGMLVGRLAGSSLSHVRRWSVPLHHVGSHLHPVRRPAGQVHLGCLGRVHDRRGGRRRLSPATGRAGRCVGRMAPVVVPGCAWRGVHAVVCPDGVARPSQGHHGLVRHY